jgi:hypothetical protein
MQPRDIVPDPPGSTLTYAQSNDLMNDGNFRGRVKVACLSYATYINSEAASTVGHNTRAKWAAGCVINPDGTAQTVTSPTVMDPAVQQAGSAIADGALQAAVQGVIDKMI